MSVQLDYNAVKEMSLAEYKKAFKEKSQWKKAKAVLFMLDYKLDGKKVPIAIPVKRPAELKPLFKQAKGDKHPSKKLGGGFLRLEKNADGIQFHIDLTIGGLSSELLTLKGGKLFEQLLKAQLIVNTGNISVDETDDIDIEDNLLTDTDSGEEADMSDSDSGEDENGFDAIETAESNALSGVSVEEIASKTIAYNREIEQFLLKLKPNNRASLQLSSKELLAKAETYLKTLTDYYNEFGRLIKSGAAPNVSLFDNTENNMEALNAAIDELKKEATESPAAEKVDFKALILSIKEGFARVKETVVPKIKEKIFEMEMRLAVEEVLNNAARFTQALKLAPRAHQEKLQPFADQVVQIAEFLEKYMKIMDQLEVKMKEEVLPKVEEKVTKETFRDELEAIKLEIKSLFNEMGIPTNI